MNETRRDCSRISMAIVMASIVMISSFIVVSPSASDGDEGTSVSPVIIAGSPMNPYELGTDGSFTTYIGFNMGDFADLSPRITITSGDHTFLDAKASATPAQNLSYTNDNGVKTTLGFPGTDSYSFSSDKGLYSLTFEFAGDDSDVGTTSVLNFRIMAELTAYVPVENSTETIAMQDSREFYYRAYIEVVDSPSEVSLYTTSTPDSSDTPLTSIDVPLGADITPIYPFVNGTQSHYDFYAAGLPDGINMISNGTISGKPAGYIDIGTTFDVKVYAMYDPGYVEYDDEELHYGYPVPGVDTRMVYVGNLQMTVVEPVDAFAYTIGSTTSVYSEIGRVAIANTDSLEIGIVDNGETGTFRAYITSGASENELTIEDGKISLDGLSDMTGVIKVTITESLDDIDFTATIHVMLVGPVVHSGLSPSVTSS